MAKPSLISQWLTEPDLFSAADMQQLTELIKTYPYFTPARFVEASVQHRKKPYDAAMMQRMQLYQGNWLLFSQYLESTTPAPEDQRLLAAPAAEIADLEDEGPEIIHIEPFSAVEAEAPYEEIPQELVEDAPSPATLLPEEEDDGFAIDHFTAEEEPEAPQEILTSTEPLQEVQTELQPEDLPEAEIPVTDAPLPLKPRPSRTQDGEELIKPLFSEDYFLYQGIEIPEPGSKPEEKPKPEKALMVVMSYAEWLMHFKTKTEREKQELEDKKALKSMWQKEKLAAALEEENEEIPESVFEMAVNSITKEEGLVSESLAEILQKQGKYDKAIDMYRKLSLRNPQKSTYFAHKIEQINKQIDS
ncbi:MAG: hypothetical protein EOP49_13720 [Sphingobacteriales bacterium]|nr:MAG: hypothetical protein EOP49_13720 [Sphingobacteriales bacterium]